MGGLCDIVTREEEMIHTKIIEACDLFFCTCMSSANAMSLYIPFIHPSDVFWI